MDYDIKLLLHPVDIHKLLTYEEHDTSLHNLTLGIDELTVFADCRTSTSKNNRIFSYLVLQSRKRNCDIYYTTQSFGMIDFRVFDHTLINVFAEKLFNEKNEEIDGVRKYTIIDKTNPRKPKMREFFMDITQFYDLYDTDEIVKPKI
ncbi:unnamed protein product [marine sediment metagenome]|uniref:Uncharacterized protein n=1 Tax=marine sediment metagenome TaxID=412755 RepID=X1A754_9ZZZZ